MCENKIENCWYMNGERCLDPDCEDRAEAMRQLYPDKPFTLTVVSQQLRNKSDRKVQPGTTVSDTGEMKE